MAPSTHSFRPSRHGALSHCYCCLGYLSPYGGTALASCRDAFIGNCLTTVGALQKRKQKVLFKDGSTFSSSIGYMSIVQIIQKLPFKDGSAFSSSIGLFWSCSTITLCTGGSSNALLTGLLGLHRV